MDTSLNVLTTTVKDFLPFARYNASMSIGKRVIGARKARGYNESAAFARACGISKQYLANIEKDAHPKADPAKLLLIARFLNITLDWLVTGEGLPSRNQMINAEEWEFVEKLRTLSAEGKNAVRDLIHKLSA